MKNVNYESPSIQQLKEEFDRKENDRVVYGWIKSTEKIIDGGEKIKLITKEGYIFYITTGIIEYKGKGEVKDTSDLQKSNVIKLKIVENKTSAVVVEIKDETGKDYYNIKYQIKDDDEELKDEDWDDIANSGTVDVPYGKTIYAKLVFEVESGIVHSLSIEDTNPEVSLKNIDTSDLVRKSNIALADLFEITWGSEGNDSSTVEYIVEGNLNFKNTSFTSTEVINLSELEIGTYKVTCNVKSKTNKTATNAKENINITKLDSTTVIKENGENEEAKAIYSEYDLAYFRDEVNTRGKTNLNGKIINDIDLSNVCSNEIESWDSIGNSTNKYQGIFEGNEIPRMVLNDETNEEEEQITPIIINNIYINTNEGGKGLFGYVENGMISNIDLGQGSIEAAYDVGGIVGNNNGGTIKNCRNSNENTIVKSTSYIPKDYVWEINITYNFSNIGGIVGYSYNGNISSCINNATIQGEYCAIGGIVGNDDGNMQRKIQNCTNKADFTNTLQSDCWGVGGICGTSYNLGEVERCTNKGDIESNVREIGGITGVTTCGRVNECNNLGDIKGSEMVGGISGHFTVISLSNTNINEAKNCNNEGIISNTGSKSVTLTYDNVESYWQSNQLGGIIGVAINGSIESCKNKGTLQSYNNFDVGGIVGYAEEGSTIKYCANLIDIENSNVGDIGGIVGGAYKCTIEECYNTGNISGKNSIGGIAGFMVSTTIKNSYNTAQISGNCSIGGIVGHQAAKELKSGNDFLYNCYSIGEIEGTIGKRDPIIGESNYLTYDHLYMLKSVYNQTGYGTWSNQTNGVWVELEGDNIQSDMLTGILNGNGAGKWTRANTSLNGGYPYLVNNLPSTD